jgi:predicted DNA binding CopG/RHH family protein
MRPEGKIVGFERLKKDARASFTLPRWLLSAAKKRARRRGISYQRLIREAVEKDLAAKE